MALIWLATPSTTGRWGQRTCASVLPQQAELELAVLQKRAHHTAKEERQMQALKRLKLMLKDRMVWVEAILSEDEHAVIS